MYTCKDPKDVVALRIERITRRKESLKYQKRANQGSARWACPWKSPIKHVQYDTGGK